MRCNLGNVAVTLPGESDGWEPLPAGWVTPDCWVITRRAHDDALAWFPIPDPSGYLGIAMFLKDKNDVAREFWMWTDASGERTARIVRLGYRRYVVELHGADGCFVLEDSTRPAAEHQVPNDERDVLGHSAVSPARTFSSSTMAESCARMWLNHGRVHDGYDLGR